MATAAQISTLYNKYLGRDPLQGGIDAWLATGQSIEQIEQGIANSPEAGVFQAFNETVGRDPTMEERDFFVNENPIGTNAVKNLLSGMEEAKAFQTQQQLDETDMLADTTAGSTLDDTTVGGETEEAFPTADTGRFGDMIDASATFADANQYLGVNEAQWSAFINEVNDIKAQMNAFDSVFGTESRVMQDRSTPDALLDRRIAVLLNQNPGMTADEARAEAESGEAQKALDSKIDQYNNLNEQLNQAYESIGLPGAARITGSGITGEGYAIDFDLNTGKVTYREVGGGDLFGGLILAAAAAIFTGPLAAALGPASAGGAGIFSSAAAAKAASGAIISSASQLAATGSLDIGQALVSAAMSYGGAQLGDAVKNSGVIGDIASQVESTANSAVDFLSQGNSIAEAAIKAGGMSMLSQVVTTGEVDFGEAATAALIAGGAQGISEFAAASGKSTDQVLEEITVDAERVGTKVGDNAYLLETGDVISVDSDGNTLILGKMSDIDLDGDGLLSSSDLQEITVNQQQIDTNQNVYGDVSLAPPGTTTTPDIFTNEWADERYAGLSGDQIVNQMQADGFTDSQINNYMEHWNATNDLNLQELNTASYGAIDVNMEDPYTIGQTDEGTYYIAKVDESGGISFVAVSEEQYNSLYDRMYGSAETGSGALTTGNYGDVENYIAEQKIGSTGNEYSNYDPAGFTAIDTDGDGIVDGTVQGSAVINSGNGWITLEEGNNVSAVQVSVAPTVDPTKTEQVTTTDAGGSATASQQAVTALTESLSSSSSSESAASAVTNAAASGLSAAEIAMAVNSALSGGSISSETASAASSALEGIASKGDVSDAGVLSASGDLATDTGSDGATVTVVNQPPGLLTSNNITADAGASGSDPNAGRLSFDDFATSAGGVTGSAATGGEVTGSGIAGGGITGSVVTGGGITSGGVSGGGTVGGGAAGGGAGGGGITGGGAGGGGATGGGGNGTTNVTTTTDTSTTAGTTTTPTTGPPGPGTTVTVGNGKGTGDGDGTGSGSGLGGVGIGIGGASGMLTGGEFAPLTERSIRIEAPEILPDIVGPQQDAVAQLMKAVTTPYGTKPSGQQLNSLFDRLLLDQEKIA